MARVKRGVIKKAKHKKVLNSTKGYRGAKNRLYRVAREAALHAGQYAFAGRRLRRRDFRSSWIVTISAALTNTEINYSKFFKGLKEAKIEINRKIMADIASNDSTTFEKLISVAVGKKSDKPIAE